MCSGYMPGSIPVASSGSEPRQQCQIFIPVGAESIAFGHMTPAVGTKLCAQLRRIDQALQIALPLLQTPCMIAVEAVDDGLGVGADRRCDAGERRGHVLQ